MLRSARKFISSSLSWAGSPHLNFSWLARRSLETLYGNFGQEMPRNQSRIMINSERLLDGGGLAHERAGRRRRNGCLGKRSNTGEAQPPGKEFLDRNLIGRIENRG